MIFSIDLSLQAGRRITPILDLTDLVNNECVHAVDCFANEGWFGRQEVMISRHVFYAFADTANRPIQCLSENTQFPRFIFSQVVQRH